MAAVKARSALTADRAFSNNDAIAEKETINMAYSELIKNFDRIRDYMRQFYVYGFKS